MHIFTSTLCYLQVRFKYLVIELFLTVKLIHMLILVMVLHFIKMVRCRKELFLVFGLKVWEREGRRQAGGERVEGGEISDTNKNVNKSVPCLLQIPPELMVWLSLLYPLILGPPVLEPNLNLSLWQLQTLCQFTPLRSADVLSTTILFL